MCMFMLNSDKCREIHPVIDILQLPCLSVLLNEKPEVFFYQITAPPPRLAIRYMRINSGNDRKFAFVLHDGLLSVQWLQNFNQNLFQ